jgi:hypothetical protein
MSQAPSIAYPGGKARLAEEIIALLPKRGRTYLEPLCWARKSVLVGSFGGVEIREVVAQ